MRGAAVTQVERFDELAVGSRWRAWGIDTALAVDLIHLAISCQHDPLVVFSSDTDLLIALEMIAKLRLGHVDAACWSGFKPLLFTGTNLLRCHFLSEPDWHAAVADYKGRV
jgi:hypothetical protein